MLCLQCPCFCQHSKEKLNKVKWIFWAGPHCIAQARLDLTIQLRLSLPASKIMDMSLQLVEANVLLLRMGLRDYTQLQRLGSYTLRHLSGPSSLLFSSHSLELGALGVSNEIIAPKYLCFLFHFVSFFPVQGLKSRTLQGLAKHCELCISSSSKWIPL